MAEFGSDSHDLAGTIIDPGLGVEVRHLRIDAAVLEIAREPAQTLPIKPGHSAVCLHHEVGSPKPTMPAEGNGNGFTLLMVARPDVVVIIKFGIRCYGYPGCILD